jgi:hypothetical protein
MRALLLGLIAFVLGLSVAVPEEPISVGGRLPSGSANVSLWWTISSAAKVQPDTLPPTQFTAAVQIRCARNEHESVQVLLRSQEGLRGLTLEAEPFSGPSRGKTLSQNLEILRVDYVKVTAPTDKSTRAGSWPDPLPPFRAPIQIEPGQNQGFWLRIFVPESASSGVYHGVLKMQAEGWRVEVPLELTVYDFALPDRMTCQTAFGFSPGEVFRYQKLRDDPSKREVLEKYWADLSAHHISPYDPAPLDPFKVTWPDVHPPKTQWEQWSNVRIVTNEVHLGHGALLVNDDKPTQTVEVSYQPFISIPDSGLQFKMWYRTAVPGHRFTVSMNHYDSDRKWISGHNRDFLIEGNGLWQMADYRLTEFPAGAKYVRLNLMGTQWTEGGEKLGLVWYDDVSLQDLGTGKELVQGGDFEESKRTELCAPADQLRPVFDFTAWDKAMTQAFDGYHFNSFSLPIPGMGGGTFYELVQPSLRGFPEDSPEYPLMLGAYCGQMEAHLRAKGWLDRAYIYWFDEPSESQYAYLRNGFAKLKQYCPDITRMITKHVEDGLVGGPNLWCAISDQYKPEKAEQRRKLGDRFWWYVCTGPKAPYTGLFIDHPAPELRIWLWQTFQRGINGILVWQCNYWTSDTAYPDADQPQNPYEDPMSWTSGYGTPKGKKLPWGNGDGRFIYPPAAAASGSPASAVLDGPVDSIRWEQLRDGIEDYEYLTILRSTLEKRRSTLNPAQVKQFEDLLNLPNSITRSMTEFARDGEPIERRRDQIARAIEALTRR